eukprot:scaffold299_cov343-Prasinococcus_capsulatus_cf.AAC.1
MYQGQQQSLHELHGLPGVGKTSVALAVAGVAFERGSTYHAAWVGLRGVGSLQAALLRVLQVMDELENVAAPASGRNDLSALQVELKRRLKEAPWSKDTLFVLDNTEDLQRGSDAGCPAGANPLGILLDHTLVGETRVIVTTRKSFAYGDVLPHWLSPLKEEFPRTCFLAEYGRHTRTRKGGEQVLEKDAESKQAFEQVLQFCGGLPLALRNMASVLASPLHAKGIVGLAASLRTRENDTSSLFAKEFRSLAQQYNNEENVSYNLYVALDVSRESLERETQLAWCSLSLFWGGDFSREAASAVIREAIVRSGQAGARGPQEVDWSSYLSTLYEAALVDFDASSDRFSMHPVVQEYAAWRLTQEEQQLGSGYGVALRDAFTAHFMGVLEEMNRLTDAKEWHARLGALARVEGGNLRQA